MNVVFACCGLFVFVALAVAACCHVVLRGRSLVICCGCS